MKQNDSLLEQDGGPLGLGMKKWRLKNFEKKIGGLGGPVVHQKKDTLIFFKLD